LRTQIILFWQNEIVFAFDPGPVSKLCGVDLACSGAFKIITSEFRLSSFLDKTHWQTLKAVQNLCDLAPSSKIRRLCLNSPKTLQLIGLALNEAVSECHKQFAHDKWDCGNRLGSEDVYLKSNQFSSFSI
jgi:hypothetical protein